MYGWGPESSNFQILEKNEFSDSEKKLNFRIMKNIEFLDFEFTHSESQ